MINLDLIVEALEMTNNETKFFFDREENDTVMLSPYSDDHSQISDMIDEDDDDTSTDRVLAAMIRMIRVLNKHVSRDELDSILEDLEETLRGE